MHTKKKVKSLNGPSVMPKTSTKDFFPGNMVSLGKCWTLSIPSLLYPFGFSQLDIYLSIWWNKKIYCSPPFNRPFSVLQGRGVFIRFIFTVTRSIKKKTKQGFVSLDIFQNSASRLYRYPNRFACFYTLYIYSRNTCSLTIWLDSWIGQHIQEAVGYFCRIFIL